jgi:hypothetical protein
MEGTNFFFFFFFFIFPVHSITLHYCPGHNFTCECGCVTRWRLAGDPLREVVCRERPGMGPPAVDTHRKHSLFMLCKMIIMFSFYFSLRDVNAYVSRLRSILSRLLEQSIRIDLIPVTVSQQTYFHKMVWKSFASANSHLFRFCAILACSKVRIEIWDFSLSRISKLQSSYFSRVIVWKMKSVIAKQGNGPVLGSFL